MENGYNGGGMVDTNSLLLARGVGGYGFGGFGAYGGGYGAFAGPSSNAVRINAAREGVNREADCTRSIFSSGLNQVSGSLEGLQRDNQFSAVSLALTNGFSRAADRQNTDNTNNIIAAGNRELNLVRELADMRADAAKCCCDTQKAIADAAKEAAKCCCDAQLLAVTNQAATIAEIKAVESRAIERSLNMANAELTALKTQLACGCHCPNPS